METSKRWDKMMKRTVLIVQYLFLILAGCSNKTDKAADEVFQPLSQNLDYADVIKTETPNKISW
jgi:hypothetical protein